MGSLGFLRPIGPKADVEELLYISALHQSTEIREDASISAEDIKHYLISRHGIKVSSETVEDIILSDFKNKGKLDLLELVTLLFIPQLCKVEETEQKTKHQQCKDKNDDNDMNSLRLKNGDNLNDIGAASPRLIEFVLEMILFDTTGDKEEKELTVDLLHSIFRKYSEDIPIDDPILQKMISVAKGGNNKNNGPVFLNKEIFLRLLTSDVKSYRSKEAELTTIFNDVFGDGCKNFGSYALQRNDLTFVDEEAEEKPLFERVKTAKGIDYAAGTYSCKYHIVMLWCVFLFGFWGFVLPMAINWQEALVRKCNFEVMESWKGNTAPFLCQIEASIVQWLLIFVAVMIFGFAWIGLESGIGYTLEFKNVWGHFFITILLIPTFIYVPIFLSPFQIGNYWLFYTQILAYLFGTVLMFKRIVRDMQSIFPSLLAYMIPTGLRHESYSKKAALNKVKLMQENAVGVLSHVEEDNVIKAYFGKGLSNFSKLKDETVPCGGFVWTWKKYRSLEIFYREGVWISARFLSSNMGQMFLSTIVLAIGISATIYVSNSWLPPEKLEMTVVNNLNYVLTSIADQGIVQNASNKLLQRTFDYLIQFLITLDDSGILKFDCIALGSHLMNICADESGETSSFACNLFSVQHENLCEALESIYRPLNGAVRSAQEFTVEPIFNTTLLREPFVRTVSGAVSSNLVTQVNKLYPSAKYMVTIPTAVAATVAFIVSVLLSCVVIPSLISTTLKLRSGLIPTLRSKEFSAFHYEVNNVTKLTGGMFWSNLIASLVIGCTIGLIIFLSLWQVSVHLVQNFIALLIGINIINFARWLVSRWFRKSAYRGFYRTKPFSANVFSLMNECLNMGLTITMALTRALSLFLLSEFYVGRLDTPFVSKGVGRFGWLDLEPYNNWFLTAILSTEAHRHPYIETLGVAYLMKLKYSNDFIDQVGVKWRTIFVTALMPWLVKYRHASVDAPFIRTSDVDDGESKDQSSDTDASTTQTYANLKV